MAGEIGDAIGQQNVRDYLMKTYDGFLDVYKGSTENVDKANTLLESTSQKVEDILKIAEEFLTKAKEHSERTEQIYTELKNSPTTRLLQNTDYVIQKISDAWSYVAPYLGHQVTVGASVGISLVCLIQAVRVRNDEGQYKIWRNRTLGSLGFVGLSSLGYITKK